MIWDTRSAAETRPAVDLLAENLNAPRSVISHIPFTRLT
jgi:hypothetical protein